MQPRLTAVHIDSIHVYTTKANETNPAVRALPLQVQGIKEGKRAFALRVANYVLERVPGIHPTWLTSNLQERYPGMRVPKLYDLCQAARMKFNVWAAEAGRSLMKLLPERKSRKRKLAEAASTALAAAPAEPAALARASTVIMPTGAPEEQLWRTTTRVRGGAPVTFTQEQMEAVIRALKS